MREGCPFCDYAGPSEIVVAYPMPNSGEVFVIRPLNPVTDGHLLVIPRAHADDFRFHKAVLVEAMEVAAMVAGHSALVNGDPGCNLIVSAGAAATQTVPHVHVHVVPRREGDGLRLPWS